MGPGGPGGVDELIGLGFLLVERSESTEKVSVRRIRYHVTLLNGVLVLEVVLASVHSTSIDRKPARSS